MILIPQVSTTTLSQMSAISFTIATALDIDEFAASINQDFIMATLIKIRDAEICVTQSGRSSCYDNIGTLLPLLNIGIDIVGYRFF